MNRLATLFTATVVSLLLFLVLGSSIASAHAKVISATPGIGSTIATAPNTVTVQTAENMNPDPKQTNLFIYGPDGELVSQGNATVALNNPKQMSVAMKPTGNGVYVVRWVTLSADDNEADEGAFIFTVQPAPATPTATNDKATTAATTPPATPPTATSSPIVPSVITGIVALLLGLGAGFGLARSRSRVGSAVESTKTTS